MSDQSLERNGLRVILVEREGRSVEDSEVVGRPEGSSDRAASCTKIVLKKKKVAPVSEIETPEKFLMFYEVLDRASDSTRCIHEG